MPPPVPMIEFEFRVLWLGEAGDPLPEGATLLLWSDGLPDGEPKRLDVGKDGRVGMTLEGLDVRWLSRALRGMVYLRAYFRDELIAAGRQPLISPEGVRRQVIRLGALVSGTIEFPSLADRRARVIVFAAGTNRVLGRSELIGADGAFWAAYAPLADEEAARGIELRCIGEGESSNLLARTDPLAHPPREFEVNLSPGDALDDDIDASGDDDDRMDGERDDNTDSDGEPSEERRDEDDAIAHTVSGRLWHKNRTPFQGGIEIVLDQKKSLRRIIRIAETALQEDGRFRFALAARAGGLNPNRELIVTALGGDEVLASGTVRLDDDAADITLVAGDETLSPEPAAQTLEKRLAGHLGEIALSTVADDEVDELARLAGVPQEAISRLVRSARIAETADVAGIDHSLVYSILEGFEPSSGVTVDHIADFAKAPLPILSRRIHDVAAAADISDPQEIASLEEAFTDLVFELDAKDGRSRNGAIAKLTAMSQPQRKETLKLLARNGDATGRAFWETLSGTIGAAQARDAQFTFEAANLIEDDLPLVEILRAERGNRQPETALGGLAGQTPEEWARFLEERDLAPPENWSVEGNIAKQRLAYGRYLAGQFETAYPTQAFAARVEKSRVILHSEQIASFLTSNPTVRIESTPLRQYFREYPGALDHIDEGVRQEVHDVLLATQRLHRVAPVENKTATVEMLYAAGYRSSLSIVLRGHESFVSDRYLEIDREVLCIIYEKAALQTNMGTWLLTSQGPFAETQFPAIMQSLHQEGDYIAAMHPWQPAGDTGGFDQPATASSNPQNSQFKAEGLPSYEDLFGSLDACACDETCESIYSYAAYLYDLLKWLRTQPASESGFTPYARLVDVRPDIPHIKLSCENTHTVLPQLQIVLELLEQAVVGDPFSARQTTWDQTQLEILEEHVLPRAYLPLKTVVYPPSMPFDLESERFNQVSEALGFDRARIRSLYNAGEAAAIWSEPGQAQAQLGLNGFQWDILTTMLQSDDVWEQANSAQPYKFYGFSTAGANGSEWLKDLGDVGELLRRSKLEFDDLLEALRTPFVNPDWRTKLVFHPDAPCDPDRAVIKYIAKQKFEALGSDPIKVRDLTEAQLIGLFGVDKLKNGKLPLFVAKRLALMMRLRTATGWSFHQLNLALQAFCGVNASVTPPRMVYTRKTIIKLVNALRVQKSSGMDVERLIALWSPELSVLTKEDGGSLYASLFLDQINGRRRDDDDYFHLNSAEDDLQGADNSGPNSPLETLDDDIRQSLGLSSDDFSALVDPDIGVASANDPTNLASLSTLTRIVVLGGLTQTGTRELLQLAQVLDFDLTSLAAQTDLKQLKVLTFIDQVERVKAFDLCAEQITYLSSDLPENNAVVSFFSDLEEPLVKAQAAVPALPDPPADWLKMPTKKAAARSILEACLAGSPQHSRAKANQMLVHGITLKADAAGLEASPSVTLDEFKQLFGWLVSPDLELGDVFNGLLAPASGAYSGASFDDPTHWPARIDLGKKLPVGKTTSTTQVLMNAIGAFGTDVYWPATYDPTGGLLENALGILAPLLSSEDVTELLGIVRGPASTNAGERLHELLSDSVSSASLQELIAVLVDEEMPSSLAAESRFGKSLSILRKDLLVAVTLNAAQDFLAVRYGVTPETGKLVARELTVPMTGKPAASLLERLTSGNSFPQPGGTPTLKLRKLFTGLDKVLSLASWLNLPLEGIQWLLTAPDEDLPPPLWRVARTRPNAPALSTDGLLELLDTVLLYQSRAFASTDFFVLLTLAEKLKALEAKGASGKAEIQKCLNDQPEGSPIQTALAASSSKPNASEVYLRVVANWLGLPYQELSTLALDMTEVTTGQGTISGLSDWFTVRHLNRMAKLATQMRKLDTDANGLRALVFAPIDTSLADTVLKLFRSRFTDRNWPAAIKPVRESLWELRRDRLIDYFVEYEGKSIGIESEGELQGYFLIDVMVSACVQTTRILQAIFSVQLFIQRCLLNLIDGVEISEAHKKEYEWLRSYSTYAAAIMAFIHTSRYLRPELRDDKTFLFEALQSELLQSELDEASVERAYRNYLEGLMDVAQLEVMGAYRDNRNATTGAPEPTSYSKTADLHVVARTRSEPHRYFYLLQDGATKHWRPIQPIDQEIPGDHVIPFVFRERFHLSWPIFVDKTKTIDGDTVSFVDVKLAHISKDDEKWSKSQVAKGQVACGPLANDYRAEGKGSLSSKGLLASNLRENTVFFPHFDGTCSIRIARLRTDIENSGWDNDVVQVMTAYNLGFTMPPSQSTFRALTGRPPSFWNSTGDMKAAISGTVLEHQTFRSKAHNPSTLFNYWGGVLFYSLDSQYSITPLLQYGVDDRAATTTLSSDGFFFRDDRAVYYLEPSVENPFKENRVWKYSVHNFFHPFAAAISEQLNTSGIDGVLQGGIETRHPDLWRQQKTQAIFDEVYGPTSLIKGNLPVDEIAFGHDDPYGIFNREMFLYAPLFIADRLMSDGKFEAALKWLRYIFDPTNRDTHFPDDNSSLIGAKRRPWMYRPFFEFSGSHSINRMYALFHEDVDPSDTQTAADRADLLNLVRLWREEPFNVHRIADLRVSDYMQNVVFRMIETLIAWGDEEMRRYTMESLTTASMLYLYAQELLGAEPETVNKERPASRTFADLDTLADDDLPPFADAMINLETEIPGYVSPGAGPCSPDPVLALSALYFCIPPNTKLTELRQVVNARLFNLRRCLNIDGMAQDAILFVQPASVDDLVAAAAAGQSLSSVVGQMHAPLPHQRFAECLRLAKEFCNEVKSLGASVLSAWEKRDSETLAILQKSHEIDSLRAARKVRSAQVKSADASLAALEKSRKNAESRQKYYQKLIKNGLLSEEKDQLDNLNKAHDLEQGAQILNMIAGILRLIPQFKIEGPIPPTAASEFGGVQIGAGLELAAKIKTLKAGAHNFKANIASISAGHKRRAKEWAFQEASAKQEVDQLGKQIDGAAIQVEIANLELSNHELQENQAAMVRDYLKEKFTSDRLYSFMTDELAGIYRKVFNLAHDLAMRAQIAYRYETGDASASFVRFDAWEGAKKGLLSGERLMSDLLAMEAAFHEQNNRGVETTVHISLALLDPAALFALRTTGEASFNVHEAFLRMKNPELIDIRIKDVSVQLPCVTGPYASLGCRLRLEKASRRTSALDISGPIETDFGLTDSIIVNASGETGVFENDGRYMQFEGRGLANSRWNIRVNRNAGFADTISDLVLSVRITARDGGDKYRSDVLAALETDVKEALAEVDDDGGNVCLFSLKRDLPDLWHRFKSDAAATLELQSLKDRLPYVYQWSGLQIETVELYFETDEMDGTVTSSANGPDALSSSAEYAGMLTTGRSYPVSSKLHRSMPTNADNDDLEIELSMPKLKDIWLIAKVEVD